MKHLGNDFVSKKQKKYETKWKIMKKKKSSSTMEIIIVPEIRNKEIIVILGANQIDSFIQST